MFRILVLVFFCAACTSFGPESPNSRKYLFLDVGASDGLSLIAFKQTALYKKYPWRIVAVEPETAIASKIPKDSDVEVIEKAAWTYDGSIDFYISVPEEITKNSVYSVRNQNNKKVTWPCFNFSNWLKANASKDDYVIMSLDIAGGEPALLESMFENGSIDLLDRLYVEFSYEMLAKSSHEQVILHSKVFKLREKIRERGILFDADSVEDVLAERYSWEDDI